MSLDYGTPVSPAPSDGVTTAVFAPSGHNLLVSSWDSTVRLYDAGSASRLQQFALTKPVLDCCFLATPDQACAGGVSQEVRLFDFHTGTDSLLGTHDGAVKAVRSSTSTNQVFSGSWDKTLRAWDPRSSKKDATATMQLPDKVFSMDIGGGILVVATAGRHVLLFDPRKLGEPMQRRESSLKFATRNVSCSPDGKGYAVGSIEGRIAIEYYDAAPEVQAKKFAFRCHRDTVNGVETVYPVNSIAFHPVYGTFASGGSDGTIAVWDGAHKRRICMFPKYRSSIASMSFSADGSLLAIAASYMWEEGEREHEPDAVYIRRPASSEVAPKQS